MTPTPSQPQAGFIAMMPRRNPQQRRHLKRPKYVPYWAFPETCNHTDSICRACANSWAIDFMPLQNSTPLSLWLRVERYIQVHLGGTFELDPPDPEHNTQPNQLQPSPPATIAMMEAQQTRPYAYMTRHKHSKETLAKLLGTEL